MKSEKPLLSICIPTYNRAAFLDKTICSIVSQEAFNSDEVELVISDNASTDNTKKIVKKYQNQHKNIFYSRNSENIFDKNFPTVISKARGTFRKLCNDNLLFEHRSLQHLLSFVRENIQEKPILFFLDHQYPKKNKEIYRTANFDSFLEIVSFYVTWIGGFGIWEDDFEKTEDKYTGSELHLWQTKTLFAILERKKNGIIDNSSLFSAQRVMNKDLSYGLYNVFCENYLSLCREYLTTNILSNRVFKYLKRHLLFDFFSPWIVNYRFNSNGYKFSTNDNIERLVLNSSYFREYKFFFLLKMKMVFFKIYAKKNIKKIILFIVRSSALLYSLSLNKKIQRIFNIMYTEWFSCFLKKVGKNFFIARYGALFGGQYIEIGDAVTIGKNAVLAAWDERYDQRFTPEIIIGDYCSIGEYCHITAINKIILGNNVLTGRWLTVTDNAHGKTESEDLNLPPAKRLLYSKGPVIIEDNVWIGDKVTITPGVTIGKNSVIEANGVVTKDIPMNCVAGGNPVKVLKYIKKDQ